MGKQELSKARSEENLVAAQLQALHEEAVIASEMRKATEGPGKSGEPANDRVRSLTRAAYFGVADIELRKRLIKLKRKQEEAFLASCRAEYREAHRKVGDIEKKARLWVIPAGVTSVTLVFVGHAFFGVPGAVAGGTLGVIFAMHSRDADERLRPAELEQARSWVRSWELLIVGEPPIFTELEADTGEPDGAPGPVMSRASL